MLSIRARLTASEFLDYGTLKRELEERVVRVPREVGDAMYALQRMLQAVNTVITLAVATHYLLTVEMLDELIRMNRDFTEVASFDELMLGPLHRHPLVCRAFGNMRAPPPRIGVEAICSALSRALRDAMKAEPGKERVEFRQAATIARTNAFAELAETHGVPVEQLGIYLKADGFVLWMWQRLELHHKREVKKAERAVRAESTAALELGTSRRHAEAASEVEDEDDDVDDPWIHGAPKVLPGPTTPQQPTLTVKVLRKLQKQLTRISGFPGIPVITLLHFTNVQRKQLHQLTGRSPQLGYRTLSTGTREDGQRMIHLLPTHATAEQMSPFHALIAGAVEWKEEEAEGEGHPASLTAGTVTTPAEALDPAIVLDHIRSLCDDLCIELLDASVLETIATVERRLLIELNMASFEDLGLQQSFVGFLSSHAATLEHLLPIAACGEARTIEGPTRQGALVAAAAALLHASSSIVSDAVLSDALMRHFGIPNLQRLGCDDSEGLRRRALAQDGAAHLPLAVTMLLSNERPMRVPRPLGALDAADALRAVRAAPLLADLGVATRWSAIFEDACGPLGDFLIAQHSELVDEMIFEAEHGVYMRVEAGGHATFRRATGDMDARHAAALVTGLCIQQGGVGHAPLELLRDQVQRVCSGTDEQGARFVLKSTALLPPVLQAAIGAPVFLAAYCAEQPDGWHKLIQLASDEERQALHRIGCELSLQPLVDDLQRFLFEPMTSRHSAECEAGVPVPPKDSVTVRSSSLSSTAAVAQTSADDTRQEASAEVDRNAASDATALICARVREMYGGDEEHASEPMRELRAITTRAIHRLAEELCNGPRTEPGAFATATCPPLCSDGFHFARVSTRRWQCSFCAGARAECGTRCPACKRALPTARH